jgi:murein L,D-transpeptidase YafK
MSLVSLLRTSLASLAALGAVTGVGPVGTWLPGGGSAHAITIEIDDVAADRVERQRAFAEGALPLVGTPDLGQLGERLAASGLKPGAHMFIRIFKAESELELWMLKGGRYELFATYPICHWAGTIGPKLREGDKQNPEGFYSVGYRQLHRIGRWPRSLNIGYPNTFDRAWGRTGSYILVHGGCSSVGCFAMTNAVMSEIFTLSEHALRTGQGRIDVHVFPFRMTEENLAVHAQSPWLYFWKNLKEGYDAFEETRLPPRVGICDRRYVIEAQRPGEVGVEGPLASCGAMRAALIEPSSQSLAALPGEPPPSRKSSPRPQVRQPMQAPLPPPEEAPQVQRSAYSGRPLPPLPTLAQQSLLLPPRAQQQPRQARLAAMAAATVRSDAQPQPPPCNTGLASCRKFLALRSTIEAGAGPSHARAGIARVSRPVGQRMSQELARLSTAMVQRSPVPSQRRVR